MNTFTRQSKQSKPIPADQAIQRFKKDMKQLGYDVLVDHGSGVYVPSVTVSLWPRWEEKEVTV